MKEEQEGLFYICINCNRPKLHFNNCDCEKKIVWSAHLKNTGKKNKYQINKIKRQEQKKNV